MKRFLIGNKNVVFVVMSIVISFCMILLSQTLQTKAFDEVNDDDNAAAKEQFRQECITRGFSSADGSIAGLWLSYGWVWTEEGTDENHNELGCPVGDPEVFSIDDDVRGSKQSFQFGTVYYNNVTKAAFALFDQLDIHYKDTAILYGMPITSEIGTQPNDCKAYFEKGAIFCNGENPLEEFTGYLWKYWPDDEEDELLYIPEFKLPFKNEVLYIGAPHGWGHGKTSTHQPGEGSGLDVTSNSTSTVVASAPGVVIGYDDNNCNYEPNNLGCWVAIRNDFSGTVLIYGHIVPATSPHLSTIHSVSGDYSTQAIDIGEWVDVKDIIGVIRKSPGEKSLIGHSEGPHVHLELRTGTSDIYPYGDPLDWHGVVIDNYLISGGFTNSGQKFDYDGTAVKINSSDFSDYRDHNGELHRAFSQDDLVSLLNPTNYTFRKYYFSEGEISSWLTQTAWIECETDPDKNCEDLKSFGGTVFAWFDGRSAFDTNEVSVTNTIPEVLPLLHSSNEENPHVSRYQPSDPNPNPTPTGTGLPNNCPSDGSDGVYFYRDKNYNTSGGCYYSVDDIPDFGNTLIGDNTLSSVKIIGEWKVQIYKDTNYHDLYDILHSSDPNLDIRSLGGQYSSAKITDQTEHCPTDGSEGVYMYSQTDYEGTCHFDTGDIANFSDTRLGDNNLSSIKFIGNWEAKIYEDPYFQDRYDVIGSDDPDLDIRSLGGQYSSVEIKQIFPDPTQTPTPHPTQAPQTVTLLSPSVNNGGFESNLNGWSASGGTFVVDTENPHSGSKYVKGTSSESATIYRSFDLSGYATEISEERLGAYFSVWIDVGKSEQYEYRVRWVDSAGNNQVVYSSGLVYHAGDYAQIGDSIDVVPPTTTDVVVEVYIVRNSGDFTDVDIDDFTLVLQISGPRPTATPTATATPLPTPIPDCSTYSSDVIDLFDFSQCNTAAGNLPFALSNTLYNLSDIDWNDRVSSIYVPTGKSMLAFADANGQGPKRCLNGSMWDLAVDLFDDGQTYMNNSISSVVIYDEPDCPTFINSPAQITGNPVTGELITTTIYIKNVSYKDIVLNRLLMGVHGPYCAEWENCDEPLDFPIEEGVVIKRGETYKYETTRMFNVASDGYYWNMISEDSQGNWYSHTNAFHQPIGRGIEVIEPIAISPGEPLEGELITATYRIKNFSNKTITLPIVGAIAKGPDCPLEEEWDCPRGGGLTQYENITLAPGQEFPYSGSIYVWDPSTQYYIDTAMADDHDWWYKIAENVTLPFEVGQAFEVTSPLTLTPTEIHAGELVTASFTVKNVSGRTMNLERVFVGVHGPYCDVWHECPNISDYPDIKNIVLADGESFTFEKTRAFNHVDDGYFTLPYTIEEVDVWRPHGDIGSFDVLPGIEITEPVTLTPETPTPGEMVTGSFTIQNVSDVTITLPHVAIIARGPICADEGWNCIHNVDFAAVADNIVLAPGETYTYSQSRTFDNFGIGYIADAAFGDTNSPVWWYTFPENERLSFTVEPDIIPVPTLLTPSAEGMVGNVDIAYSWEEVFGADRYTLEIRKVSDNSIVHSSRYNASAKCDDSYCSVTVPGTLEYEDYKWRVKTWVGTSSSEWSNYHTFATTLAQVDLRSPGVNATVYGGRPTFIWYQVEDALSYIIEFYDATTGSDVLIETWQKNPVCDPYCTYRIPRDMDLGANYGEYKWRIFAKNSGMLGEWSEMRTFTYSRLNRTVQVSPANGFSTSDTTPEFQWEEITGATMYLFQVRLPDDTFVGNFLVSDTTYCVDGGSCTWELSSALPPGEYKWHVRAKNGRNFGRWTAYRTFTINLVPE